MKFGRKEKKKLIELLDERFEDFIDGNGVHKERWNQYLAMNGITEQPCRLPPSRNMVVLKTSSSTSFLRHDSWYAVPKDVAMKILVLGFAPPRNKRKERPVEYRVERNGRKVAVAPTVENAGSKMFRLFKKARADHTFTIFDPEGRKMVEISKRR
jgi:hypothetical protein